MEQITGRLTADAKVNMVNGNKQVVNFSIAVNDRYKTKAGETKENTRFIKCAYWTSTSIAPFLQKGGLVELAGRIDVHVWSDLEGKPKGTLTMHVNNIRLLGGAKGPGHKNEKPIPEPAAITDDLPF